MAGSIAFWGHIIRALPPLFPLSPTSHRSVRVCEMEIYGSWIGRRASSAAHRRVSNEQKAIRPGSRGRLEGRGIVGNEAHPYVRDGIVIGMTMDDGVPGGNSALRGVILGGFHQRGSASINGTLEYCREAMRE